MKAVAAIALVLVFLGHARAQSEAQVAHWCRLLFVYRFDFDKDAAWKKQHEQALSYFRNTSRLKLAAALEEVVSKHGVRTTAGAGALYLMVLHDVNREQNLDRLIRAHRPNHYNDVDDNLPDALADIAIRLNSRKAARALVGMPNGEYFAETQAMAVHRLFMARPELLVSSVSQSPRLTKDFLQLLPFGAWNNDKKMVPAKQLAAKLARQTRGANRQIYLQITRMKDDWL